MKDLPANILFIPPETGEESPKGRPNETNLGLYLERVMSVKFWEIFGQYYFVSVQPRNLDGTHTDFAVFDHEGATLYEFTTKTADILDKIERYGKEYPVVIIIIGKTGIGFLTFQGGKGFIMGLQDFAAILDEKKIPHSHEIAQYLRKLDIIASKAKKEIACYERYQQQRKDYERNKGEHLFPPQRPRNMENFNYLKTEAENLNCVFRSIKAGNNTDLFRIVPRNYYVDQYLKKSSDKDFKIIPEVVWF